eukprot:SAG31_NODE_1367_length_8615_cov_12.875763_6_plen_265_part_00
MLQIGKVAYGLAELVDVYPTLADLSNSGRPQQELDGVSLAPFFEDSSKTSFPTPPSKGVKDKTFAFSQYPHSVSNSAAASCRFFFGDRCFAAPHAPKTMPLAKEDAYTPGAGKVVTLWMGYSARNASWRYTGWVPHNGTAPQWQQAVRNKNPEPGAQLFFEELYDHRTDTGTDFDAMDTFNLAYVDEYASVRDELWLATKEFFSEVVPPSPIAPPPPPPVPACDSWCARNSHPWPMRCTWPGCSLCPECDTYVVTATSHLSNGS